MDITYHLSIDKGAGFINKKSSSDKTRTDVQNIHEEATVVGNERMTALAGAILLVLFLVELVSAANLQALLSVHVFIGVLLSGPLVIKIMSTSYRFFRYYTRSPAFVRKGPPRLALRVLSPLLLVTTLVVIGSGIGLEVAGPTHKGLFLPLHVISVLIWLPLTAIHLLAHIRGLPRLIASDLGKRSIKNGPWRMYRLGIIIGSLVMGTIAATLMLPVAAPWIAWSKTNGGGLPQVIVGLVASILVVIVTRPQRWE